MEAFAVQTRAELLTSSVSKKRYEETNDRQLCISKNSFSKKESKIANNYVWVNSLPN